MALTREALGARIAAERERAELTQLQLAEAIGLERSAISRIEQGRQGVDSLQLAALAEALGRPPAALLGAEEEQPMEVLRRAPRAQRDDVARQLRWLEAFVRDYTFLSKLEAKRPAA